MEIGTSNINTYSNAPSQAAILNMQSGTYWQTTIDGFSVGSVAKNAYALKNVTVIFEAGTAVILTPASMGTFLIN